MQHDPLLEQIPQLIRAATNRSVICRRHHSVKRSRDDSQAGQNVVHFTHPNGLVFRVPFSVPISVFTIDLTSFSQLIDFLHTRFLNKVCSRSILTSISLDSSRTFVKTSAIGHFLLLILFISSTTLVCTLKHIVITLRPLLQQRHRGGGSKHLKNVHESPFLRDSLLQTDHSKAELPRRFHLISTL